MRIVVVAILLAACGGSKDDCERVYDKLTASIAEFHKDQAKWLRTCRAESGSPSTDPQFACALEADSAAAVRKCMGDAYADHDGKDALEKFGQEQEALAKAKAEAKAKALADEPAKAAAEALERIEGLERDLADIAKRRDDVVNSTDAAHNAADRAAAQAKLAQLRAEQADMQRRIAEAKAAAARAERTRGITVSKECIDNPLAKGCM